MPDIAFPTDEDRGDDLDASVADDDDALVVDGLTGVLEVCAALHEHRVAAGLSLDEVAARSACHFEAIEWVDEGDVAAPVEALVYYAVAVGLCLRLSIEAP
jgi:hypothetical protein